MSHMKGSVMQKRSMEHLGGDVLVLIGDYVDIRSVGYYYRVVGVLSAENLKKRALAEAERIDRQSLIEWSWIFSLFLYLPLADVLPTAELFVLSNHGLITAAGRTEIDLMRRAMLNYQGLSILSRREDLHAIEIESKLLCSLVGRQQLEVLDFILDNMERHTRSTAPGSLWKRELIPIDPGVLGQAVLIGDLETVKKLVEVGTDVTGMAQLALRRRKLHIFHYFVELSKKPSRSFIRTGLSLNHKPLWVTVPNGKIEWKDNSVENVSGQSSLPEH